MQTILLRIAFLLALFLVSLNLSAQVDVQHRKYNATIDSLRQERSKIENQEKEMLKKGIEALQEKLKEEKISTYEFENDKKALAEKHAKNIQSRTLILDETIEYLKRNEGEEAQQRIKVSFNFNKHKTEEKVSDSIIKTAYMQSSGIYIAVGFSNTIGDHSLGDSPYKLAGSRFFETGWSWRSTFKKNGATHIRYGLALQVDGYKPTDNRYFVKEDNRLHLEEYPIALKKAKLRVTNLVVPLHFEFEKPSLTTNKNGRKRYSYDYRWQFGIGGYAGMNLKSVQKLKYKEFGKRNKIKQNMTSGIYQPVYGLSAYVGKGDVKLYVRYALSELFKDHPNSEHTLAVGVRLFN